VSAPRITYVFRPNSTQDTELNVLASVYKFVLDRRAMKEAAPESRPDDPERRSDEIRAKRSIPKS
jgi:hypothetical protein